MIYHFPSPGFILLKRSIFNENRNFFPLSSLELAFKKRFGIETVVTFISSSKMMLQQQQQQQQQQQLQQQERITKRAKHIKCTLKGYLRNPRFN